MLAVVAATTVVLVLLAAVLPPDARVVMARIVVVSVGLTLATLNLRRTRSATSSTAERFELELRRPPETPPPVAGLRAVEVTVRLATASALDFDVRLRPLLRDLARWRLLTNRGVDLDSKPEAARRVLGEPLASLVEGPGEPPAFGAPGVPLAEIDAALDQLEQI
jgi:hypothetical protein